MKAQILAVFLAAVVPFALATELYHRSVKVSVTYTNGRKYSQRLYTKGAGDADPELKSSWISTVFTQPTSKRHKVKTARLIRADTHNPRYVVCRALDKHYESIGENKRGSQLLTLDTEHPGGSLGITLNPSQDIVRFECMNRVTADLTVDADYANGEYENGHNHNHIYSEEVVKQDEVYYEENVSACSRRDDCRKDRDSCKDSRCPDEKERIDEDCDGKRCKDYKDRNDDKDDEDCNESRCRNGRDRREDDYEDCEESRCRDKKKKKNKESDDDVYYTCTGIGCKNGEEYGLKPCSNDRC